MEGGESGSPHDQSMFSIESWVKMWDDGQWGFHCRKVNDLIIQYYDRLFTKDGSSLQIFIPLCGKSLDMKWLADKGHHVVGVDCAPRAAIDFFTENKMSYTTSEVKDIDDCTLYKSKDGRIEFYVCDYFALTKDHIGGFDVIWDRGSLNAMPLTKSSEYVQHIRQFMKSGTRILLDLFECFDDKGELRKDMGLSEDDVHRLYDNCSCEVLGTYKYKDIEKDMSMDTMQKDSFNEQVKDEAKKTGVKEASDLGESGDGHDVFENMIGKTYLLVVK